MLGLQACISAYSLFRWVGIDLEGRGRALYVSHGRRPIRNGWAVEWRRATCALNNTEVPMSKLTSAVLMLSTQGSRSRSIRSIMILIAIEFLGETSDNCSLHLLDAH